ncbi:MAG: polysaccharide deacetylase family protein [Acidimicrobiales bacterium]
MAGLGVDMPAERFADRIDSLARRYTPVGLDGILDPDTASGRQKVLICFDDAYASVAQIAAPLLAERGLPWCLFLNPGFVGNDVLGLDNFVAYVAATVGLEPLAQVAGAAVDSPASLIRGPLAWYTPGERRRFMERLASLVSLDPAELAGKARLYLDRADVGSLAEAGVEIGNHTAEHVSCRALDAAAIEEQVVQSAADIEAMSARPVRAFAYPYGSSADATDAVVRRLRETGHRCAFVVEAQSNTDRSDPYRLRRICLTGRDDPASAVELAVLPQLRMLRSRLRRRSE